MKILKYRVPNVLAYSLVIASGIGGAFLMLHSLISIEYVAWQRSSAAYFISKSVPEPVEVLRVALPDEVRGLYWTAATAASYRANELLDYMQETGLNAVVIDLKMDNGALAFVPDHSRFLRYTQDRPAIQDLNGLLERIGQRRIYRIARIAVMRDGVFALEHPELAVKTKAGNLWRDDIGSLWLDPAASEVAAYAVSLGQEAYARGFDEVQYDYIRFPSDGNLGSISYPVYDAAKPKVEIMQNFFEQLGGRLSEKEIPTSFDLFGMTFWSTSAYGIGQRLIDSYPYADFISPMVYPSHYADGFRGHANPAEAPYDVVNSSLEEGIKQLSEELSVQPDVSRPKIRPWLQDFDIGAIYTSELIEAQIKAARDAGASGWLLWNARNVYEPADYLGTSTSTATTTAE